MKGPKNVLQAKGQKGKPIEPKLAARTPTNPPVRTSKVGTQSTTARKA